MVFASRGPGARRYRGERRAGVTAPPVGAAGFLGTKKGSHDGLPVWIRRGARRWFWDGSEDPAPRRARVARGWRCSRVRGSPCRGRRFRRPEPGPRCRDQRPSPRSTRGRSGMRGDAHELFRIRKIKVRPARMRFAFNEGLTPC